MTSHYTDQGALLIRNSDIKDGCFEFGDNPIYLDDDFAKQNASRKHRVGDVITVHTGDIGTSAVISEKEAGSIGFATIVTRPNKDIITSDYLCIYLNTDTHKNFAMNISTGDGRNNYNLKDYYECVVPVPSLDEQNKISDFIKNINHLITLYQCKVDKLTAVKKSMLEKMFPKNGRDVPEIRFKGFTEAWEQRKLSSLCDKFTDGDWIELKDQSNSGVRLIQTGNVGVAEYLDKPNNKKWISNDTFEALHCEEVFEGDILISRLPEPAGRACILPNLSSKMITAVDCMIVRVSKDTSNKFLLQYLSSQKYFDEVNTCLAGGTRQRISRSNLANFDVAIPVKKSEQEVIGIYFENLDHLITLYQRKLEKLQNIKKSMLEKMFV